ncbi:MAG: ribonuclease III [Terriglobales bacterium]
MTPTQISALEKALGHQFQRTDVLEQAVTHSSHARESQSRMEGGEPIRDNEQLEFLGDAVLGFVTSRELCRKFPEFQEGQLSKLRAFLVSEKHLIRVAKGLKLGEHLRLGRGEEKSGGREKPALLVDALEAVLAALYLDAGLDAAERFILKKILHPEFRRMQRAGPDVPVTDFKSALQETAHTLGWTQPAYVLVRERGPEHQKTFTIEARLGSASNGDFTARAHGPTKKQAEQGAARKALEHLRSLNTNSPQ